MLNRVLDALVLGGLSVSPNQMGARWREDNGAVSVLLVLFQWSCSRWRSPKGAGNFVGAAASNFNYRPSVVTGCSSLIDLATLAAVFNAFPRPHRSS